MSFHRENVLWQSRNGTWNLGFYECHEDGGEDSDPEWDVEYDFSRFDWVSTGHPTQKAARESWKGSNPGGGTLYEEPCDETDALDTMAEARKVAERAEKMRYRQPRPFRGY